MGKIDFDKFVIALLKSDRFNYQDKHVVKELLKDQGLKCKNGEIKEI